MMVKAKLALCHGRCSLLSNMHCGLEWPCGVSQWLQRWYSRALDASQQGSGEVVEPVCHKLLFDIIGCSSALTKLQVWEFRHFPFFLVYTIKLLEMLWYHELLKGSYDIAKKNISLCIWCNAMCLCSLRLKKHIIFHILYNIVRGGGKSHMFKSQASLKSLPSSLKSQYKQIKQVKSSQWLTSSKSSRVLIRVKSSQVTVSNRNKYIFVTRPY